MIELTLPRAFLFNNPKYIDEQGNEIPEFQQYGICGLQLFHERYPHAPVYLTNSKKIPSNQVSFFIQYFNCTINEKKNECA